MQLTKTVYNRFLIPLNKLLLRFVSASFASGVIGFLAVNHSTRLGAVVAIGGLFAPKRSLKGVYARTRSNAVG